MLVLALDTTTAAGSVALAHDEQILEVAAIDPAEPIATRVPGDLIALLARHRVQLPQIEIFAVATGPGSFTGLRIGIATMQGLALANGKPLIGVSSFEALATLATMRGDADLEARASRIAVWIDAWRGEVYAAMYVTSATTPAFGDGSAGRDVFALRELIEPTVAASSELLSSRAMTAALADGALFVGDGAVKYRDLIPAGHIVEPTPLLAGAIAQLAYRRAQHGEAPPPHAIRPLYVRRPDAELAREKGS